MVLQRGREKISPALDRVGDAYVRVKRYQSYSCVRSHDNLNPFSSSEVDQLARVDGTVAVVFRRAAKAVGSAPAT